MKRGGERCAVQVALNIRPLIAQERSQGCKDCIRVVPREPQVQIGSHSFTFDHVFGSTGIPLAEIYDRCVAPLVDGLFHGYNATVLAYGQTGSGKTYTMGTGYKVGGSSEGVIPKVMETIFRKVETLKAKSDFQLRVSFIEILKEEVHDLLDPNPPTEIVNGGHGGGTSAPPFGGGSKIGTMKPPIQIRETSNGGITLAGVTESDVNSLNEMATCLETGSLCRATGSTNMNSSSSRSHAIFTITVEQRRKWDMAPTGSALMEDCGEDYLCAKLHLVDLAGSERAKRTGADGLRFKEGIHINKGLLALGNVISALGDDKKRKEGGHVPYRDSKLTRLLQDSLGGNSRTVMIACVSPADSNAEETLNTLKYANRARNIQNKPTVNRDPMAAEMQHIRQQLEIAQAELMCARAGGPSSADIQMLKQKVVWLEASNIDLHRQLEDSRIQLDKVTQKVVDSQVNRDKLQLKLDQLRAGKTFDELDGEDETDNLLKNYVTKIQELEVQLQQMQSSRVQPINLSRPLSCLSSHCLGNNGSKEEFGAVGEVPSSEASGAAEAEAEAKEWEHTMLQENLDKELQELNKRLEQKEAEMKSFAKPETVVLKQHFERKLLELEEEKKSLQGERDSLMAELESLATTTDENAQKLQETYKNKLKQLEAQIADLKKKQENQSQLLRQKQRSDEAAKRLQEEIQRIKTHKVQLQQKMKQESEQFRAWKGQREKEVLQLRKEGRRNVYEMHKLQALHQRQKMVLQRKSEEAAAATRRLKEVLEARKSTKEHASNGNEKSLQQWLDQELEVAVRVHEVRSAYEKQMEERAAMAKEVAELRQEEEKSSSDVDDDATSRAAMDKAAASTARTDRINMLESLLTASSSTLVAMSVQLSEAEERERTCNGRARWQNLRSMGDAKTLLHLMFNVASLSRCQLRDTEEEGKELKDKLAELEDVLRQSEAHRQELDQELLKKDQQVAALLDAQTKGSRWTNQLESDQEWDSDLELSEGESDEDWLDVQRMRAARKIRAGTSGAQEAAHKPLVKRKLSGSSSDGEGASKKPLRDMDSFARNHAADNTQLTEQQPTASLNGQCCSCSQSSGCKTKKCACKAAGALCGPECRCKLERCANRGGESMMMPDAAGALGSSQGDSAIGISPIWEEGEHRSHVGILDEVEAGARRAERAMVSQAASLLETACKDVMRNGDERQGGLQEEEQLVPGEEDGEKVQARRRPLADVGNIKLSGKQAKPKRKLQRRALVQLVQVPRESEPPSDENPVVVSASPAILSSATAPTTTTPSLVPAAAPLFVSQAPIALPNTQQVQQQHSGSNHNNIPSRMLPSNYQPPKLASPQASPLRSRHNTLVTGGDSFRSRQNPVAAAAASGEMMKQNVGVSGASSSQQQLGGGIKKKESSIPGPATKHEKENIRSTLKDSRR
ncbi:unnamed protein product [Sphagnum troendelagicum]|uniref:Kinesin motor domain-containing protein n=1 Tax=Sphagnum troendelagicum TaxID=128251 RepID=A0ABP0TIM3_9BRYO